MGTPEQIHGKLVTIHFDGQRCIHSRHCVLDRPDVFVPNVEGEWIHPDSATPEEVAALARSCPSGAIRYERTDGGPQEEAPLVNVIRVRENGPLALHADAEIVGHGRVLRATLCRCGASKSKPFCDSQHSASGFTATGEPPRVESQPLAARRRRHFAAAASRRTSRTATARTSRSASRPSEAGVMWAKACTGVVVGEDVLTPRRATAGAA